MINSTNIYVESYSFRSIFFLITATLLSYGSICVSADIEQLIIDKIKCINQKINDRDGYEFGNTFGIISLNGEKLKHDLSNDEDFMLKLRNHFLVESPIRIKDIIQNARKEKDKNTISCQEIHRILREHFCLDMFKNIPGISDVKLTNEFKFNESKAINQVNWSTIEVKGNILQIPTFVKGTHILQPWKLQESGPYDQFIFLIELKYTPQDSGKQLKNSSKKSSKGEPIQQQPGSFKDRFKKLPDNKTLIKWILIVAIPSTILLIITAIVKRRRRLKKEKSNIFKRFFRSFSK